MTDTRFEVCFVRRGAEDRVWSRRRFGTHAAAAQAARRALGKPLGDSVTPIVRADVYRVDHVLTVEQARP